MGTENKPPETKTTTQLEAPPPWAIALTQKVVSGFADVEKRLDAMEANIDIQKTAVQDVMQRMTAIEQRQSHHSDRVRQVSEVDLGHDAAIAALTVKANETDAKVEQALGLLVDLKSVAAHPMVRRIAYSVGALVLAYVTASTARLQSTVEHAVQHPPAPAVVVDGGAQ